MPSSLVERNAAVVQLEHAIDRTKGNIDYRREQIAARILASENDRLEIARAERHIVEMTEALTLIRGEGEGNG